MSSPHTTFLEKVVFRVSGQAVKWLRPHKNLSVGDLVVLREDNTIPTRWPLMRISSVHPGKDGVVRVVMLKTSTGLYTRPVSKVAPFIFFLRPSGLGRRNVVNSASYSCFHLVMVIMSI